MQKKYSIKFLITASLAFFLSSYVLNAQSCNSELRVVKNRNARSAMENDPTRFQMELTNNSSSSQTYEIQYKVFEDPCEVVGASNSSNRSTDLNVAIYSRKVRTNSITVPARSKQTFLAEVSVNIGSKLNAWKCVRLTAVSNACSEQETQQLLKVYVSDPTEH
ncbi:MAG: hypothetical protein KJO05_07720 [Bacteroidia bacterium]|nr:hypothetical protein [Bacteroidia bacterium]NNF31944.1 hypothetical protein [Flavobacteriaceae bacterium]MBT8275093.1 hypothetical protein [Bacteroidia bacterium]NNJ81241.1 hypothetical protein [Flavobacteriaceae bacterium]NNK52919.1 hypothetical protein [Flavobacteriaceae bacterium]